MMRRTRRCAWDEGTYEYACSVGVYEQKLRYKVPTRAATPNSAPESSSWRPVDSPTISSPRLDEPLHGHVFTTVRVNIFVQLGFEVEERGDLSLLDCRGLATSNLPHAMH
jgi:hypothetical protein